jgi:hypothetical protein
VSNDVPNEARTLVASHLNDHKSDRDIAVALVEQGFFRYRSDGHRFVLLVKRDEGDRSQDGDLIVGPFLIAIGLMGTYLALARWRREDDFTMAEIVGTGTLLLVACGVVLLFRATNIRYAQPSRFLEIGGAQIGALTTRFAETQTTLRGRLLVSPLLCLLGLLSLILAWLASGSLLEPGAFQKDLRTYDGEGIVGILAFFGLGIWLICYGLRYPFTK